MSDNFQAVMPYELRNCKLSPQEKVALWGALSMASAGIPVFASVLYPKQTTSPPRIEEEDYLPMPGVSRQAHFGPIVRVFRTKAEGLLRFTIWSIPRQGFTTIIPEGLERFISMPTPEQSMFRQMRTES